MSENREFLGLYVGESRKKALLKGHWHLGVIRILISTVVLLSLQRKSQHVAIVAELLKLRGFAA